MGSCTGGEPSAHKMHITIYNRTEYALHPSSRRCKCPKHHNGFNAIHGKFLNGHIPVIIASNSQVSIVVGGRSWSAVCPAGWFEYTTLDESTTVICTYARAGWSSVQNRAHVRVTVTSGELRVLVRQLHPQERNFTVEIMPGRGNKGFAESEAGEMPMDSLISLFADLLVKPARYNVDCAIREVEQRSSLLVQNAIQDASQATSNVINQVI